MSKTNILKKGIILGIGVITTLPFFAFPAVAQGVKDKSTTKKDETILKRCERVKAREEKILDQIKSSEDKREEALAKLKNGLNKVIDNAKKQGLDTSKIETDLKNVIVAKQKLASLNTQVKNTLAEIKSIQCEDKTDNYGQQVKDAIEKQKEYKETARGDFKKALQSLRINLKALKEQKAKNL